ncbi:hypothetical protein ACRXCV_13445 [Halobacteriovorax sp. GFR7]|uniref:hypothetical protein n=1 Tax=unclassified Halobacteriovorax TaxID=2639665 RepID=UPI003D9606E0
MSTAKKLDQDNIEKPAACVDAPKVSGPNDENPSNVLEFSITKQIKDVDLSKLGESSEENTGSLNNLDLAAKPVGDITHTQILNLAKSSTEVDVLEAQVKLIALFVSEARLLEGELNKYIHAIHKQSPQSKKYLLQMRKVVKDFSNIEKILEKARSVK